MSCVSCGLPGVEGTCSMCYGDPYHNTDGEYLRWIEEQQRQNEVPPCDICGGQACADESGFNVCSEACAEVAKRAARTQEESEP